VSDSDSYPNLLTRLWRYLALFVKRPTEVATLVPSSRFLTRKLSEDPGFKHARHVVELGPGDGSTTRALLAAMQPEARLLAIELVAELVDVLQTIDDKRCIVEHADANELHALMRRHDMQQADVIVSGIPFSNLAPEQAAQIIDAIYRALTPGGVFVAYQFRDQINGLAERRFGDPEICFVPWNIPPVSIYRWTKATVPVAELVKSFDESPAIGETPKPIESLDDFRCGGVVT